MQFIFINSANFLSRQLYFRSDIYLREGGGVSFQVFSLTEGKGSSVGPYFNIYILFILIVLYFYGF